MYFAWSASRWVSVEKRSSSSATSLFGCRSGNHPAVPLDDLAVPDDLERLTLDLGRLEHAAVVAGGEGDLLVGEELRRLAALGPEDQMVLDGVELGEGAVDPLRRRSTS
jgi:hypothetical protein